MNEEEQKPTAITFTTDNIEHSRSREDQQYFVHIIKNPLLRLLLRVHIIKEPEKKPAPAPVPQSTPAPEKRPQCRVTIRVSGFAIAEKRKNTNSKIAIILLAITSALGLAATLYFVLS